MVSARQTSLNHNAVEAQAVSSAFEDSRGIDLGSRFSSCSVQARYGAMFLRPVAWSTLADINAAVGHLPTTSNV